MAMIDCEIIKTFPFSEDGFTTKIAEAGKTVGIPDDLVDGLARAGYLRAPVEEAKAVSSAPENKAIASAPENKHPLDHDRNGVLGGSPKPEQTDDLASLRAEYQAKLGKRPFNGWDGDTLRQKIAEAGNGGA